MNRCKNRRARWFQYALLLAMLPPCRETVLSQQSSESRGAPSAASSGNSAGLQSAGDALGKGGTASWAAGKSTFGSSSWNQSVSRFNGASGFDSGRSHVPGSGISPTAFSSSLSFETRYGSHQPSLGSYERGMELLAVKRRSAGATQARRGQPTPLLGALGRPSQSRPMQKQRASGLGNTTRGGARRNSGNRGPSPFGRSLSHSRSNLPSPSKDPAPLEPTEGTQLSPEIR